MLQKMWAIPASAEFIKYIAIVGTLGDMPEFEHKYLGHQLTAKNSLAKQVDIDENVVRIIYYTDVEHRRFCFDYSNNMWYVLVDN